MGTYKANELGKFLNDLKKQTEKAIADDISREIYSVIQKFILEEIYNKYSPKEYERTYETLRSLKVSAVYTSGNTMGIRIYFSNEIYKSDEHNMWYDIPSMGLVKKDRVTVTEVLDILEQGLNPYRPDAQVMDKSIEELKSTQIILKRLVGYLRSRGFKIV